MENKDYGTQNKYRSRNGKIRKMKQITVTKNEAGQRADKLLAKYLKEAPKSFLYKMMRKKNIVLNGKKMQGNEILQVGDELKLFLADETVEKFQGSMPGEAGQGRAGGAKSGETLPDSKKLPVLYEDDDIVLLNKPVGMLSQKAQPQDISAVEYLLAHLLENGSLAREQLRSFRPSVCNRLDRNTTGILIAGKSLVGLQTMSELLRDRSVHKYYCCIVKGKMEGTQHLKGYLVKDGTANQVRVSRELPKNEEAQPIETKYRVIASDGNLTLLEVLLLTGRSHQIRAHLSSIGHPILGDPKYGDPGLNVRYKSRGVKHQLLHAWRLEFPDVKGELSYLSGKTFTAPLPGIFLKLFPQLKSD